jgi:hypothetical protein
MKIFDNMDLAKCGDSMTVAVPDDTKLASEPINNRSITDQLICLELSLPQGERMTPAKVIGLSMDDEGKVISNVNENPILNTTLYDVEFPNGMVRSYAANVFAENIYNMVNDDSETEAILDGIVGHRSNQNAVTKDNIHLTINGTKFHRKTTAGWQFEVAFKVESIQSTQWISLKELKKSNPVQVAEYVTAKGVASDPAFFWWVPYTLKYGVEIPRSIDHARKLDKKNNNRLWMAAYEKEMRNVSIAFEIMI